MTCTVSSKPLIFHLKFIQLAVNFSSNDELRLKSFFCMLNEGLSTFYYLNIWIELLEQVDSRDLFDACLKNNVAFVPRKNFFPNSSKNNTFEDRIVEEMKRLGEKYVAAPWMKWFVTSVVPLQGSRSLLKANDHSFDRRVVGCPRFSAEAGTGPALVYADCPGTR